MFFHKNIFFWAFLAKIKNEMADCQSEMTDFSKYGSNFKFDLIFGFFHFLKKMDVKKIFLKISQKIPKKFKKDPQISLNTLNFLKNPKLN